jgi:hypothetical protein
MRFSGTAHPMAGNEERERERERERGKVAKSPLRAQSQ